MKVWLAVAAGALLLVPGIASAQASAETRRRRLPSRPETSIPPSAHGSPGRSITLR